MVRLLLLVFLLFGAVSYKPETFVVVGRQQDIILLEPMTPIKIGVFQEGGVALSKGDILYCTPSTRVVPVVVAPKLKIPELQSKFNMNQIVLTCGVQRLAVTGIQWGSK